MKVHVHVPLPVPVAIIKFRLYFTKFVLSSTALPCTVAVQTVPKVPVLSWPMGLSSIMKFCILATGPLWRGPKREKNINRRGPHPEI